MELHQTPQSLLLVSLVLLGFLHARRAPCRRYHLAVASLSVAGGDSLLGLRVGSVIVRQLKSVEES